ncbi:MFS transporter [Sulfobacillus harzensis]|uniref:MFS transporter n=1 Tax=Sulfobacillus harzensis TaxID=2729629 RepID=A0A7Y0L6W5_9FIRM|nr:MFS transporter [Sulfobacillus harzensis]NMP23846.1 MFS transporter [Sulfobacillus harzensis]
MSAKAAVDSPAHIIARLDRLSVWSFPYLFIVVIGAGFLFTFYDIFNINVSFIQTCTAIVHGCSPATASKFLGLPVLLNLGGYVVGTLVLSPLADKFGRRDMLLVTMIITGLGSLWNALAGHYAMFTLARAVTGIGIGADLAIVNTYINEVAPAGSRARYTSLIFIMSAFGAFFGIWLGLFLTTPATPFPLGLPFAIAGAHFVNGWRWMYIIGAVLAVVGLLLRYRMPESPRWLISRGRVDEADQIVTAMERRAASKQSLSPVQTVTPITQEEPKIPYSTVFGNVVYRNRTLILVAMWFISYVTVYCYASGFTSLLSSLHYPPPEAGLIAAFGTFGFILCAIVAYLFGEMMERKYWIILSAVLTLLGGVIVAEAGTLLWLSMVGSGIAFFGFNLWVPISYAWSTEHYPTRARATGFALVDGVGHLGGGLGVLLVVPFVAGLPVLPAFLVIGGFLVLGALIAQFGVRTRGLPLDQISP